MDLHKALEMAKQQINKKIDDALEQEVFEVVKNEEISTINDVVYGVYSPKQYERRYSGGGIGDPLNIQIMGRSAIGGKLIVVNVTQPNPGGCNDADSVTTNKNLVELIEYGHGYNSNYYDFPNRRAKYVKPRPFTSKTIEHLKVSKAHISALKNGLVRQGVNVK